MELYEKGKRNIFLWAKEREKKEQNWKTKGRHERNRISDREKFKML